MSSSRQENYWTRRQRQMLSRRTVLKTGGIAAAGVSAWALAGCGDDDDPSGSGGSSSAPDDAKTGGELVIAIGEQPAGLSGSLNESGKFDTFWQQIYNCLVWFDENMVPSSGAASRAIYRV